MNADEVSAVENDEHMILGTVAWMSYGYVFIRVDHCEAIPRKGQRVKVLVDDTGKDNPNA